MNTHLPEEQEVPADGQRGLLSTNLSTQDAHQQHPLRLVCWGAKRPIVNVISDVWSRHQIRLCQEDERQRSRSLIGSLNERPESLGRDEEGEEEEEEEEEKRRRGEEEERRGEKEEEEEDVNITRPVSYRLRIHQLREPAMSAEEQEALRYLTEHMSEVMGSTPELLQLRAQPLRPLIPGPDLNRPVVQEPQVEVKYEQRVPTPAHSVVARCGEAEVAIEVKQDFFGNGELIRPSDLTLGGCAAVDADDDHVLHFRSELHGCSSTIKLTEDTFVYTFSLIYAPTPVGSTVVFKTSPAEVTVECRYQRRHYVSSGAVTPAWTTFATAALADQQLRFDLRLMTDDWRSPRPSGAITLSDVLHMEASVVRGHHVPLRVYVDTCVASVNPDPSSHPPVRFITNHG
ncbi:unnamed protein product [Lampetra planeri]